MLTQVWIVPLPDVFVIWWFEFWSMRLAACCWIFFGHTRQSYTCYRFIFLLYGDGCSWTTEFLYIITCTSHYKNGLQSIFYNALFSNNLKKRFIQPRRLPSKNRRRIFVGRFSIYVLGPCVLALWCHQQPPKFCSKTQVHKNRERLKVSTWSPRNHVCKGGLHENTRLLVALFYAEHGDWKQQKYWWIALC